MPRRTLLTWWGSETNSPDGFINFPTPVVGAGEPRGTTRREILGGLIHEYDARAA